MSSSNRSLAGRLGAAAASPSNTRRSDEARQSAAAPAASHAPAGVATTKFTLLLDSTDGAAFDELHLKIKRAAGSSVRKSDIIRTLLALATEDITLRDQVVDRLTPVAPS